jgi:hypothetical protein
MRITSWRPHACAIETALLDQAVEKAMRGPTSTTTADDGEEDTPAGKLGTHAPGKHKREQQPW